MSRWVRAFASLAIFAVILGACAGGGPTGGGGGQQASPAGAGKPAPGGTVTFALENDVINFDPMLSRAFVDRNVHYQIYDSLVRIDAKGKIIPWLATKWETAADGKTVTFSLRSDVKYHDGTAFDAESVKWNIDRYRTTKGSARSGELAPVETVEVVDPQTVRFKLKAPFSAFLAQLVDRAGMMVSRKAAEAGGEDFTRKAFRAGTGPFILTEAVKDDRMVLERNPNWWGTDKDGNKLPFLDKIIVRPITDADVRLTNVRTGNAHVINSVPFKDMAALKSEAELVLQQAPGVDYFRSLIPNRAPGFTFNEGRYVKAVAMAIDRKEILDKVYFGVGTVGYGTVAPPHFAYDASFKPYERPDVEGAKRLVREVGKGPLRFEMLVRAGDAQELQLAQLIQAQLAKAEITVDLKQLQFAEILALQSPPRKFPGMTLVGWSGRIDPDGNTYDHIYSDRPFNDSSYSNKEVDRLLDEQRATTDEAKRKAALRAAEQIYVVDDPARVWFRFGTSDLLSVKQLQGLEPYPDQMIRFQFGWLKK